MNDQNVTNTKSEKTKNEKIKVYSMSELAFFKDHLFSDAKQAQKAEHNKEKANTYGNEINDNSSWQSEPIEHNPHQKREPSRYSEIDSKDKTIDHVSEPELPKSDIDTAACNPETQTQITQQTEQSLGSIPQASEPQQGNKPSNTGTIKKFKLSEIRASKDITYKVHSMIMNVFNIHNLIEILDTNSKSITYNFEGFERPIIFMTYIEKLNKLRSNRYLTEEEFVSGRDLIKKDEDFKTFTSKTRKDIDYQFSKGKLISILHDLYKYSVHKARPSDSVYVFNPYFVKLNEMVLKHIAINTLIKVENHIKIPYRQINNDFKLFVQSINSCLDRYFEEIKSNEFKNQLRRFTRTVKDNYNDLQKKLEHWHKNHNNLIWTSFIVFQDPTQRQSRQNKELHSPENQLILKNIDHEFLNKLRIEITKSLGTSDKNGNTMHNDFIGYFWHRGIANNDNPYYQITIIYRAHEISDTDHLTIVRQQLALNDNLNKILLNVHNKYKENADNNATNNYVTKTKNSFNLNYRIPSQGFQISENDNWNTDLCQMAVLTTLTDNYAQIDYQSTGYRRYGSSTIKK